MWEIDVIKKFIQSVINISNLKPRYKRILDIELTGYAHSEITAIGLINICSYLYHIKLTTILAFKTSIGQESAYISNEVINASDSTASNYQYVFIKTVFGSKKNRKIIYRTLKNRWCSWIIYSKLVFQLKKTATPIINENIKLIIFNLKYFFIMLGYIDIFRHTLGVVYKWIDKISDLTATPIRFYRSLI